MNNIVLILKGFLVGSAKVIPGVSGAILAISLGIYEKILRIIGHPLRISFEDIKFLLFLFIGVALGILAFSFGIMWCLDMWRVPTTLLFLGFIVGGTSEITSVIKERVCLKNVFIFFFAVFLILFLTNLSERNGSSDLYFLMGCLESLTTIIPGISGTAIFMSLGWYESVLKTISDVLTFKASFYVSFNYVLGFLISTILIARAIGYLFDKYKVSSYFGVLGFMVGSLFTLFFDLFSYHCGYFEILVGIILFFFGTIFTGKINAFFDKF